jgi:hypothetical protein
MPKDPTYIITTCAVQGDRKEGGGITERQICTEFSSILPVISPKSSLLTASGIWRELRQTLACSFLHYLVTKNYSLAKAEFICR